MIGIGKDAVPLTVANRLLDQGQGEVTVELVDGSVMAVTPEGTVESRPAGTAGPWERAVVEGAWLVFRPTPTTAYAFTFVDQVPGGAMPGPPPVAGAVLDWTGDFLEDFNRDCMFLIGGMDPAERQAKYQDHRARGYTHILLSFLNGYPRWPDRQWDWYDTPARWRQIADEIRAAGLWAIPGVHPRSGDSMDQHLDRVRSVWSVVGSAPLLHWGYEINDLGGEWGSGGRQLYYVQELHALTGAPGIVFHFTPQRWSGWPGFDGQDQDHGEVEWLIMARNRGGVAVFYQDYPDIPADQVIDRAIHLPSPHGWRPGIAGRVVDGSGLTFLMGEYARDRARGERIGAAVMQAPTVRGFGNGGPGIG